MRYNPDTERGIKIEDFDTPWQPTAVTYPEPERVWDCQNGHWIDNPRCYAEVIADPKDDTVPEVTVQLWSVCHKLQQLSPGDIEPATPILIVSGPLVADHDQTCYDTNVTPFSSHA